MSTTTITHLVFDLDETLYLPETGLLRAIDKRIELFLQEKLGLEMPAVTVLRREYYQKYGTTLRGVRERYGIDPDEYFHYAYLTGVEEFLTPDPLLRRMLEEIPLSKVIFSNSPMEHIARVLKVLGVDHCFQRVFDIRLVVTSESRTPFPTACCWRRWRQAQKTAFFSMITRSIWRPQRIWGFGLFW